MAQIAKDEFLTPLRQDIIDDTLRFVPNIFPHKGYPWNYGSFPQVRLISFPTNLTQLTAIQRHGKTQTTSTRSPPTPATTTR